jgi:hypothetical protein
MNGTHGVNGKHPHSLPDFAEIVEWIDATHHPWTAPTAPASARS